MPKQAPKIEERRKVLGQIRQAFLNNISEQIKEFKRNNSDDILDRQFNKEVVEALDDIRELGKERFGKTLITFK